MAITGTIRSITPRWQRATPGVLLAILGRIVAVGRGRMRTHGIIAGAAAVVAGALHLARRVAPEAVAAASRLSALARGRNRAAPEAPTLVSNVSAVTATVRLRTLSDGTPRTLSTGTARTFL